MSNSFFKLCLFLINAEFIWILNYGFLLQKDIKNSASFLKSQKTLFPFFHNKILFLLFSTSNSTHLQSTLFHPIKFPNIDLLKDNMQKSLIFRKLIWHLTNLLCQWIHLKIIYFKNKGLWIQFIDRQLAKRIHFQYWKIN